MVVSTTTLLYGPGKALVGQIANHRLDTWMVVLLIWAGISLVLMIGFVIIVPIVAPRNAEKQRQRDALHPGRTPPPTDTRYE